MVLARGVLFEVVVGNIDHFLQSLGECDSLVALLYGNKIFQKIYTETF